MSKNLQDISHSGIHNHCQLAKGLRFRISTDGKLYGSISHSSGEFYVAPEILTILSQIANNNEKLNIKKLSTNLKNAYRNILENVPDDAECEAIINDLIASGFVVTEQNTNRYLQDDGFGDEWIQWAMLADSKRTHAYENAILSTVNKNSIVADIGAGSGLLTAISLKAGAKKVFAIEETQIAKKIVPILNQLKLTTNNEKLTVVNQNSFDVTLPYNITHIVSELFGNDPFQEGVIPTLRNIAQHFTKQPIYIPQKISVYFELIDIIEHPIKHRIAASQQTPKNEFLAAAKKMFSFKDIYFPLALHKNNFKRITKPMQLGQLPLNPPLIYTNKKAHPLNGSKKIKATEQGECSVGLMWFRVHLTDKVTISSHPQENDAAEHWSPMLFLIDKPIQKGTEVTVSHKLNEEETNLEINIFT